MALPSEYTFGKVVARIVQSVADGSDEDRFPDMLAAGGSVLFRPKEKNRKTTNYSALVLNQNVRATLYVPEPDTPEDQYAFPPGTLLDQQGNEGVWLVTGSYTVDFTLNEGSFNPFDVVVTEDYDSDNPLDLIHAAPPEPVPGTPLVIAEIPPGGQPDQTLVRDESGQLIWQDILDDDTAFRAEEAAQQAKSYMETSAQNAAKMPNVFVQDAEPENPVEGDLWFDTSS